MGERDDRDRRASLVFVPGFMQRGEAWAPVAERVAQRYPSTLLDFARNSFTACVAQLIAALAPGGVAVGYSMGGRIALLATLREPARFGALVLVGAGAGIESGTERRARRMADESLAAWIERHSIEQVVQRWERQPVFASQSPELVAAQRAGRLSHDPAGLATLLRSAGQGAMAPVWERLGELTLPVLVIAGERDGAYAEVAQRMAAALPHGRWQLVPGAGHAPQLERPAEVADALLEFLDEHLGQRPVVHGHA